MILRKHLRKHTNTENYNHTKSRIHKRGFKGNKFTLELLTFQRSHKIKIIFNVHIKRVKPNTQIYQV